jgi:hypothetical protein
VSTDPFVPPDRADRPRQQQNLPPGLGYPPARSWRANRPGDLGAEPPNGTLRGRPGPNVGYGYTLAERAREQFRLVPHEDIHDALSVVAEIAMKRAALLGRAPVMADVELAMALLGYDGSADARFAAARAHAVRGAAHDYPLRRALVDSVPDSLLDQGPAELGGDIARWREEFAARGRSGDALAGRARSARDAASS